MESVPGHAQVAAGAAHGKKGCREVVCLAMGDRRIAQGGGGHGVCECGERSPHVLSNRERRTWHREHKTGVDLMENGRRLASERDDLIAAGVDPTELVVPLAPL